LYIVLFFSYEVSDVAAAALANGLMKDLGIITDHDRVEVLDANKILREKKRICSQAVEERTSELKSLRCIGLDGKKDKNSLIIEEIKDDRGERRVLKTKGTVDHYSFTVESGPSRGEYLTHRDVKGPGTGRNLASLTYQVVEEYESVDSLEAVIVDNTKVNTGYQGGLVHCLEKKLGRKVHMIGCALHTNELPLGHLISELDGATTSGTTFSGPIGQNLGRDIWTNNTVAFEPISSGLILPPDNIIKDLSTDQRLLLEYIRGVDSGAVNPKFVHRKIGPLNHSRWLTCAIRILALYTRSENPEQNLVTMVIYIQKIYGKYWFRYKCTTNFTHAPQILFEMIKDIKNIKNVELENIVFPVLQRNAFCCLGENFLTSLLFSDVENHRKLAANKILEIRQTENSELPPAARQVPEINFDASDWTSLVDLGTLESSSPPCLRDIPQENIESMVLFPGIPPDFGIHSQSVERAVKLTSAASKTAYSWEKRHELIVGKNKSRKLRKRFDSKKDYT